MSIIKRLYSRRYPRDNVNIYANYSFLDNNNLSCEVLNLCPEGALLRVNQHFVRGDKIILKMNFNRLTMYYESEVKHCKANRVGIGFYNNYKRDDIFTKILYEGIRKEKLRRSFLFR